MSSRRRYSYDKFKEDRDKATELSKSGFRLDTLSDDLHREVGAIKKITENCSKFTSNKDYDNCSKDCDACTNKSILGWCTIPIIKRTRIGCKVCTGNT